MLFRPLFASNITHHTHHSLRRSLGTSAAFYLAMGSSSNNSHIPTPSTHSGESLASLPKSWHFPSSLPPDPLFPTPADSHQTPRDQIRPRQVRGALYTWVRPEPQSRAELLAVSPAAFRDLGLSLSEAKTDLFLQTAVGNHIWGWDENHPEGGSGEHRYPWAQCYGGFQFGEWAGQLGDGRAISLFEATNPRTGRRYEVQLKGAGITPYSRFADGKAVLRSSIREFVASEALHALGIPSTRALALSLLPDSRVRRETIEPGAIVVRMAESWIRLGSFDILRARGDRALIRRLATYVAEDVFGGWDKLPGRLDNAEKPEEASEPRRGVGRDEVEGPEGAEENRFARLYREVVRRNALTVAKWQAYGFMNGVLNTDNTSILGLSIDFGPFAFMDNFDPNYTPNHDDHFLRYSYRNQATIIWWNLVRFGEALGELIGAGPGVDDEFFVDKGVREDDAEKLVARAEKIITQVGEEYKAVFYAEYKRLFTARLGLKTFKESDFDELFSGLLDTMEELELDFNLFFRRLSTLRTAEITAKSDRLDKAGRFFYKEGVTGQADEPEARRKVADWLEKWRVRAVEDWGEGAEAEEARIAAMKAVNPNFIPRGWILDEIIRRVEKEGEREVLNHVITMATHPFEDSWAGREFDGIEYKGDAEEEQRWVSDVPEVRRAMQCSCSS